MPIRIPNTHNPIEVRQALERLTDRSDVLQEGAVGSILIGAGVGTDPSWGTSLPLLSFSSYIELQDSASPASPTDGMRIHSFDLAGVSVPIYVDANGLKHHFFREMFMVVRNVTGSTLTKGTVVYISGSTGFYPEVSPAKADAIGTMPAVGLVHRDIDHNGFGVVATTGRLETLDTSAWSEGTALYVSASTAGVLTSSKPAHPNYVQQMGVVMAQHATQGEVVLSAPFMDGDSQGTIQNEYHIGDGAAGTKTLTFHDDAGHHDLSWDGSQITIGSLNFTTTGTISGINVTSGADPGHTHSAGSITEADPVVGAITGIVKADGVGNISAAVADTDYLTPGTAASTYVPYSGATSAVDLGAQTLTTTGQCNLGTTKLAADSRKLYFGASDDYTIEWDGNDAVHTISAGDFVFTGGNVGVGTSTPGSELVVYKDQNGITEITVENPNAGASSYARLVLQSENSGFTVEARSSGASATWDGLGTGDSVFFRAFDASSSLIFTTGGAAPIYFGTDDSRRMTIDATGQVGVGTSNPQAKLHAENSVSGVTYPMLVRNATSDTGTAVGYAFSNYSAVANRVKAAIAFEWDSALTYGKGDIHVLQDAANDGGPPALSDAVVTFRNDGDVEVLVGNLEIKNDSKKLILGAGNDASLYYDGTNLVIDPKEVGAGYVDVQGTLTATTVTGGNVTSGSDPGHTHTAYEDAGAVSDHETTYDHDHYDTAYGWGDHSAAGYLTTASAASTYVPYSGATSAVDLGAQTFTTTGECNLGTTKLAADNRAIYFGASDDAAFWWNGSRFIFGASAGYFDFEQRVNAPTITGANVTSGSDPGHTHTAYESAGAVDTHESTYNHDNYSWKRSSFNEEIAIKYADLGQRGTETHVYSICNLGLGILLAGTRAGGKIYRSTDYGRTWTDLGQQGSATRIHAICYLENGIVIAGAYGGHIFRSTDYGATWSDLGQQASESTIYSLAYCGKGVALAGTYSSGKVLRSTDWGATWTDLGNQATGEDRVLSICYLGDDVVVAGTGSNGHIIRSTDAGANWSDLGQQASESYIWSIDGLGDDIAIAGTGSNGKILRSTDAGANWSNLGQQQSQANVLSVRRVRLTDGIALAGTASGGLILRSTDWGATWSSLGQQASETNIWALCSLPDGVTLAGTSGTGKILRNHCE